jgi:DNA segregation ATPase FtsK/SpoIIIE-like protein
MKWCEKKLLREAKKIVFLQKNHSVAHLQRKLGIGYNRAAELMSAIRVRKRRSI